MDKSVVLTREQADILLQLIELGSDGNWVAIRDGMIERGYNPGDIVMATGQVAAVAGVDNPISEADF